MTTTGNPRHDLTPAQVRKLAQRRAKRLAEEANAENPAAYAAAALRDPDNTRHAIEEELAIRKGNKDAAKPEQQQPKANGAEWRAKGKMSPTQLYDRASDSGDMRLADYACYLGATPAEPWPRHVDIGRYPHLNAAQKRLTTHDALESPP